MNKHHTTKLDPSTKKLALRKELIRELQIKELEQVAGGFKTTEKSTGCC
ncbi:MAG TPA: class I lanthipeptide [Kofleriaceae bacterium]